jgi:hypothetical protein
MMNVRPYLRSRLVQIGLLLSVGGSAPLLLIILAASLGLTSDPNPNPIGPGILVMLTFWPGVLCVLLGVGLVGRKQRRSGSGQS